MPSDSMAEVAFLWSGSPTRSVGSSSAWRHVKAHARHNGAESGRVGAENQAATLILVTASAGLVASGHALRRGLRLSRKAQGRLVRPPLPPYMEPEVDFQSEALVRQDPQDAAILVHPATQALEDAMTTDSLRRSIKNTSVELVNLGGYAHWGIARTLCKALATASGTFSPASVSSNPDRTTRPKMDTALTIRALLRYCELRHTAGDDLTPKDFLGRSGTGVRALLRMCRNQKSEVAAELEDRGDDVVRMIKAFHDQGEMVLKYLPFFRTAIEKSIPALLRQTLEPLPRVISFLEPYGEIQLSFLYEAAKDRVLKARLNQFEPRHLLEVTDKWVSRARNGKLAVIMAHKARVVVRHVASLDIDLAPPDRAAWMGMAVWGSVLETSEEDRIRKGAFYRGDPVEMLSIAERMAEVHGLDDEMFQLIRFPLLEALAMQKAGPERAAEALASLTFATGKLRVPEEKARMALPERLRRRVKIWKIGARSMPPVESYLAWLRCKLKRRDPAPPPKPKEARRLASNCSACLVIHKAFSLLLTRLMEAFTTVAPLLNLEIVLERWVAKNFQLEKCEKVTRDIMLQRLVTEDNLMDPTSGEESLATLAESPSILPGPLARCSSHLISLGLPGHTLAPAIDWLLSEPAGWSEKKAYPEMVDPQDIAEFARAATTKFAERSLPLLSHLWPDEQREGQDSWNLQLGSEREDQKIRQADLAANQLLQWMTQRPMFSQHNLHGEAHRQKPEERNEPTATDKAPWLLKAAKMCADSGMPGDEPPGVLARSIGLLARTIKMEEISLLSAEWALGPFEQADECGEAVDLVSSSCAQGGVAEGIVSDACSSWLEAGCTPGSLGVELAEQSLLAWERDGVHDQGTPWALTKPKQSRASPTGSAIPGATVGAGLPRKALRSPDIEAQEKAEDVCFLAVLLSVIATGQMGLPAIEDLSTLVERHPCYTASHLQSIDIMGHLTLRSMAVALGSNMFRGSDSQVPAFWLPPWVEHPAHSSATCDTSASPASPASPWYHAPPLPRLTSLLQKGWVINLGAGDGSCAYDTRLSDL
eukprot:s932_g10.t1